MGENSTKSRFRPGDWVEVRPLAEILGTLDARGAREGLPFMPEMVACCGRRFQVDRRVEKAVLEGYNTVARLKNTVLLDQVRCDGRSHGGCARGCAMLWKEVWLKPAAPGAATDGPAATSGEVSAYLPTVKDDKYYCQATELVHCTSRLPWWDFRQYVRDYFARPMSLRDWAGILLVLARKRLRRVLGLKRQRAVAGRLEKTSSVSLALQPGELVQVKNQQAIVATLDAEGKNRGLEFVDEMASFCGRQLRVLRRVDRIIIEWTGEMRPISDTVILDRATCTGMACRFCPRDCHHLWREIWLERVTPSPAGGQEGRACPAAFAPEQV